MNDITYNKIACRYTITKPDPVPVLTLIHKRTGTMLIPDTPYIVSLHDFVLYAEDIVIANVTGWSANPEKYNHQRFFMTLEDLEPNDFCPECYSIKELRSILLAEFRQYKRWHSRILELQAKPA